MRPLWALAGGLAAGIAVASAACAQTTGRSTLYDVNLQDNRYPSTGVQVEAPLSGQDKDRAVVKKLHDWGVDQGETRYSDKQGRWYLFAAASNRSVGLNVVRDGSGHFANDGLTTDQTVLEGTAAAGIGWRKGDRQVSIGFQERHLESANDWQADTMPRSDHGVGLTFSRLFRVGRGAH